MPIVRRAFAEDFKKIYPLLIQFNKKNPRPLKRDWQELFKKHWDSPENYYGYILVEGEEIVGFLGLIFSRRLINGKSYNFCDMGNWIVYDKYREQSLSLLLPVLKLKDYTITVQTAEERVNLILKRFGFKELGTRVKIILPLPKIYHKNKNFAIEFNKKVIPDFLSDNEKGIFQDHLSCKGIHLVLRDANQNCYVVLNKTVKKRFFPFARIHYIGNREIFLNCIEKKALLICLKLGVLGFIVDERYINNAPIKGSISMKLKNPSLFKSNLLDKNSVDSLYSEWLVLNS